MGLSLGKVPQPSQTAPPAGEARVQTHVPVERGMSHSNHSGGLGFYFVVGGFACLLFADWLSLFASVSNPGWIRIILYFLDYSARIIEMGYHAWFIWCRRLNQGLPESSTLPTEPHSQCSGPFLLSMCSSCHGSVAKCMGPSDPHTELSERLSHGRPFLLL